MHARRIVSFRAPRGFAMIEAIAVGVVAVVVICLLLILGQGSRRLGRIGEDLAHLKELGAMTGQYSADNAERFWTFSWVHGQVYQTQYPDLNNAADDLQAAANQMVYLIRTRGNMPTMPAVSAVIPHFLYSHLVLADYGNKGLPWLGAVSSGDKNRRQWEMNPGCFFQNCFGPNQPDAGNPINWRYAFSSSFSPVPAFFDGSPVGSRIEQSVNYNTYLVFMTTAVLGGQLMSSVANPSQKVVLHDQNAWHLGSRQPYCTHTEARLPLLMADGASSVRAAKDANPGWQPNNPMALAPTQIVYSGPPSWMPPPLSPSGSDYAQGQFRWTRQGLGGRDFGGPEVP